MLVYNPAFDIYHTVLRILKLESKLKGEIEIERIRIYDFFYLFPSKLRLMRLPREATSLRKLLPEDNNPYSQIADSKKLFEKMMPFQVAAIKTIVSLGFFEKEAFSLGKIKRTNSDYPPELKKLINEIDTDRRNALIIISQYLDKITLYGLNGLKSRSSLIEYRYDPK